MVKAKSLVRRDKDWNLLPARAIELDTARLDAVHDLEDRVSERRGRETHVSVTIGGYFLSEFSIISTNSLNDSLYCRSVLSSP